MTLRCPQCRSRRATFATLRAHLAASGHQLCGCGGYHFRHRPGSPFCQVNPLSPLRETARHDGTAADLLRCARALIEEFPHAAATVKDLLLQWDIDGAVNLPDN